MENILTVKNLYKNFEEKSKEDFKVLHDINLEIKEGEFFVFVGPSGSGKSTLLRIMSGLEKSYKGQIDFRKDIGQKDFSFVFQQFALLPWLTVYENVALGLVARNISKDKQEELVNRELSRLGLSKFAKTHIRELSGGMRQRVGIARALVTNPKIIFMDEPFSELDSFTAESLRKEFLNIWHEQKTTVIMVTHLIPEALELADRIAV